MKLQKRVNILASLTHHYIRAAHSAVAADKRQLSADNGCRLIAAADKHLSEHTGGCRFAVSTCYGNRPFVAVGNQAEHLASFGNGDFLFSCRRKLRIVSLDSRGVNHKLGTVNIFGFMPHKHLNAVVLDAVKSVALADIGACYIVALCVKNLGKRTHTRAADTDKMYVFNFI